MKTNGLQKLKTAVGVLFCAEIDVRYFSLVVQKAQPGALPRAVC
ncbi:hypothetical protein [Mariniphaga anaerophila]|nr:hypothetical protein [Mariniphaga anaerophila]